MTAPHSLRFDSPLGEMLAIASDEGITGLYFVGQKYCPELGESAPGPHIHPALAQLRAQVTEYFAGARTAFDLRLDLRGTPFQRRVWQALLEIPFGSRHTYAQVSAALGNPTAVRAVGAAIGRNPISVIVPCHRVVGTNGSLTGYAGGLERKQKLLALEGREPTRAVGESEPTQTLF